MNEAMDEQEEASEQIEQIRNAGLAEDVLLGKFIRLFFISSNVISPL